MNERDRLFYLRFQRRAAVATPDVAKELLRAWRIFRDSLSDAEVSRLISEGRIDAIIDDALLDRSLLPLRAKLIEAVQRGFKATLPDLPKGGRVDGTLAVGFDHLSPDVITAIRKLDSRVVNTLKDEVRETVRAFIENGLRDGRGPRAVAREIRGIIGLAPNQATAVENFRRALMGENPNAGPLDYKLRDRRFDALLRKGDLSPEQVDRMTDAYRRKMLSFNANSVSKTATLDSYRLGQRLSWESARDRGVLPEGAVLKQTWVTVGDDRVRDEHVAMSGETIAFDATWSNGETIPGESTYGCRCLARVFVAR